MRPIAKTQYRRPHAPEYYTWQDMKKRCLNPSNREYGRYGARGITICPEWVESFATFYAYVGSRPSAEHTLDRIDNNGNYEPGNVRWATRREQASNTRVARLVTIGDKTLTLQGWAREMGFSSGLIRGRERKGWSLVDAITTPLMKRRARKQAGLTNKLGQIAIPKNECEAQP
jgi:hypothetical protein